MSTPWFFATLGIAPSDDWIAIQPRAIITKDDPVTYFDVEQAGNRHSFFSIPTTDIKQWDGFTFSLIGVATDHLPSPDDDWPAWAFVLPDNTGLIIQVRWLEIPAGDGSYAQLTYRPGEATIRTRALAGPGRMTGRKPDPPRLAQAYRLLDALPSPPGPKPDLTPEELEAALLVAIRAEWVRLRERPSLLHLALYFSQDPTLPRLTDESLRKRIGRAELDLEDLYRRAKPDA
jgi:hypothetical protein